MSNAPLIVYDSKTGNVERFIQKIDNSNIKLKISEYESGEFILVTYTTGFGQVSETTQQFLKTNYKNMIGVCVSGNKGWGDYYGRAGDHISSYFQVPLLMKFELSGTDTDVEKFKTEVDKFDKRST